MNDPAFWARVEKRADGCWEWLGQVTGRGHPKVERTAYGGTVSAYGYGVYLLSGEWPRGRTRSVCGNIRCIRREHRTQVQPKPPRMARKPKKPKGPPSHAVVLEIDVPERAWRTMRECWENGIR